MPVYKKSRYRNIQTVFRHRTSKESLYKRLSGRLTFIQRTRITQESPFVSSLACARRLLSARPLPQLTDEIDLKRTYSDFMFGTPISSIRPSALCPTLSGKPTLALRPCSQYVE
jgi:hypothetical protein